MTTKLTTKKAALYSLILSLAVSGLLGIIALIVGSFGDLQVKVLLTSVSISAGSILALACGAAIERGLNATPARIGIAFACGGTALLLLGLWAEFSDDDYWRVTASLWVVATALALVSLLSFAKLASRFSWLPKANWSAVIALSVLVIFTIWIQEDEDLLFRLIGIASIIVTVLTITTPVLHYVSRMEIDTVSGALPKAQLGLGELPRVVNLAEKMSAIADYWKPHVAAELNGQAVKLARIKGSFDFHHHDLEDEFFLVLRGQMEIEFRNGTITLREGEGAVVPRGMEHRPIAHDEAHILLFEPIGTLNTGNLENERTVRDLPSV